MKPKKVVCIFAHPDDESFGPSGTIAKLAKEGEVYLICATSGEAGENKLGGNTAKIRRDELRRSSKILGVKKIFFLGFKDGTLSNNLYHKIADKIQKVLDELKPDTILTNEWRGVSGHIDHIVMSMVSTYLFEKLSYIRQIYYHCLTKQRRSLIKSYFVFFPPGFDDNEIDLFVDISPFWEKKIKAVKTHKSQAEDVKRILGYLKKSPKVETFLVRRKKIS